MTRNCGSFILSTNLAYYMLRNDSSFVPTASKYLSEQRVKSLTSISPYFSAGYGQNIVLTDNLSVILIVHGGIGAEKQEYTSSSLDEYRSTNVSYRFDGFGGILFNKPNYFISLTSELTLIDHRLIRSSFVTNTNRLTLNFGYRINMKSRIKWIGNKIGL